MPVYLNSNPPSYDRQPNPHGLDGQTSSEFHEQSNKFLTIGLINNMPDGALVATERQFLSLLNSASDGITIRLSLYSLPGVPRNESGARHVSEFYSSTETLWDTHLDGLIVTGREPLTPSLSDEPYWESFTRVLGWARENTYSTVWSCLAAHAATLHMDGVGRIRSANKHCGVFDCAKISDHLLTEGTPSRFNLPHSRWNGLPEDVLTACGYDVLTRSADVGVDTFTKQLKSLFVFFQGHPEYESNTLLLEYRRDVGRFIRGETEVYPLMPRSYFDNNTVLALTMLQQEARTRPQEELMAELSELLEKITIENTWTTTATRIYRNWLQYIRAQEQLRSKSSKVSRETQTAGEVDGEITPLPAVTGITSSAVFTTGC
jgi:homoserine O-succinyltransferase/O-acetyltransferase